ncbi:nitronate monooxygenase [Bradyrhizobium manausense]|uniref:NAD(P)H-dependent flavin oxidoreductase n=1 Tax=Bradyrhizobium manausense TaxID=989370 RepID=UPI001BADCD0F|nr:nitronate monooxygenase family protein [Bradyrhizobium manausense]MBR0828615.1 nitronate monooxygenase [Bradyrhizobium manausense]
MALPAILEGRLRLPAIAAPMFLTSGPDLVVEACRSGIVGTFPALNQRTSDGFVDWLRTIEQRLTAYRLAAPYGVNLIVHKSNARMTADLDIIAKHKVPLVITSLGVVQDVVDTVHSYGGVIFHDVVNRRHAEKAAEAGVDGIVAVCAGAGGHAGALSPFALIEEIRSFYSGTIILSGAMSTGRHVATARMMGADLAYLGSRFLATRESLADPDCKRMVVESRSADVIYTPNISGVPASFMRPSLVAAGLDPENLPSHRELATKTEKKAFKSIWSAGQGIGAIRDIPGTAELCERMIAEYRTAIGEAMQDPFIAGKS